MSEAIISTALPLCGAGDSEEIVFEYSYRHSSNKSYNEEVVASPTKGTPKFVFLYVSDAPHDSDSGTYTEWPYYPGSTVRVPLGGSVSIYKYSSYTSSIEVRVSASGQASIYSYRNQNSYYTASVTGSIIFIY